MRFFIISFYELRFWYWFGQLRSFFEEDFLLTICLICFTICITGVCVILYFLELCRSEITTQHLMPGLVFAIARFRKLNPLIGSDGGSSKKIFQKWILNSYGSNFHITDVPTWGCIIQSCLVDDAGMMKRTAAGEAQDCLFGLTYAYRSADSDPLTNRLCWMRCS